MNFTYFIIYIFLGLFLAISEILGLMKKNFHIFFSLCLIILFVVCCVSRFYGYYEYSDLKSYLWRYQNRDNAYFGNGYKYLCLIIYPVIGPNGKAFLAVISIIIFFLSMVSLLIIDKKNTKYFCTFFLLFTAYWGFSFSTEVIRTGIGISLSLISVAFAYRLKLIPSLIFSFLATTMHWTEIFVFLIAFYVYFAKKKENKDSKRKFFKDKNKHFDFKKNKSQYSWKSKYYIILVVLILLDVSGLSFYFAKITSSFFYLLLSLIGQTEHYGGYLEQIQHTGLFSVISLQYIFYRFLAFIMIFKSKSKGKASIFLNIYIIGLIVFTIMNPFDAVTRMTWIFLIFCIYEQYRYIVYSNDTCSEKIIYLLMIIVPFSIMSYRYLGYFS